MSRALILNASYEPLAIVSRNRALVLVITEQADLVAADGVVVATSGKEFAAPTVIRLRRYVRIPYRSAPSRPTLRGLIHRDGTACAYCAKRTATTIDHILPRSRGGEHTWENTCGACARCNNRKADRTPAEARMTLRVTPTVPPRSKWLFIGVGTVEESWRDYLEPQLAGATAG